MNEVPVSDPDWSDEEFIARMYDRFASDNVGDSLSFVIEKKQVEHNRSFSADAMEWLRNAMFVYTGARIMAAWRERNEPPTHARVTVTVEVA